MKILFTIVISLGVYTLCAQKINRQRLVERHTIILNKPDTLGSLTIGNGNFAFTADITGLQTFPEYYKGGVPLGTQSDWGWHSFPNTAGYKFEETLREYDLEGKKIKYSVQIREPERNRSAVDYFRVNPHRLQLGNIGLEIKKKDGSLATISDIKNVNQQLNMWTGEIRSKFTIEAETVEVSTYMHQEKDMVAVRIYSVLLKKGQIKLKIRFPYPNGQFKDVGINYTNDEKHSSVIERKDSISAFISHTLDTTKYYLNARFRRKALVEQKQAHYFLITPIVVPDNEPRETSTSSAFEACFYFSPSVETALPSFDETRDNSIQHWKEFWASGGAVDFSGSTDPRATELERRVILSQYLLKAQEAAANPPQETGLTYNSWYGRPHMEMHWWHAVQYALWGRADLMERSLSWYFKAVDTAKAIAGRQGFKGVRWQKMTDNQGHESPSSVGAFLIWQQPHLIYMAELLYRDKKDRAVLEKYRDLVFATADFMASFPTHDKYTGKYNLGKGLIPAQETFDPLQTYNPTYELAYWHWALSIAQQWRERLGLARDLTWDDIINNLAPLPKQGLLYIATESTPDSYTTQKYMTDHPAVLGAYASIPAANGLDSTTMKYTLEAIFRLWHWDDTWGWDYPLTAMTATRLNMPEKAVDALLMPVQKNTYLVNGHNYQDGRLTIYLPGNGGLLSAVAMMCAGYDGSKINEPGFPKDGTWKVKWEGLKKIF